MEGRPSEASRFRCRCRLPGQWWIEGGSLGSDEPPFLAVFPVLGMGISVRSNFKEPPEHLLATAKKDSAYCSPIETVVSEW